MSDERNIKVKEFERDCVIIIVPPGRNFFMRGNPNEWKVRGWRDDEIQADHLHPPPISYGVRLYECRRKESFLLIYLQKASGKVVFF